MVSCFIDDSGTGIARLYNFSNSFASGIFCYGQGLSKEFVGIFRFFGEDGFER